MTRNRIAGPLGLLLLLVCTRADALSIGLAASDLSLLPGEQVTVDIVVAGLGAGAAPTISGFDLDLDFGAPTLTLVNVGFGSGLGTGLQVLNSTSLLSASVVDLAAASLLASATLDAQQPASFVLATLTFQAVSPGLSELALTQALLADTSSVPGGNQLFVDSISGVSIVVTPEPGTLVLVASATGLLAACRSRGRPRDRRGSRTVRVV